MKKLNPNSDQARRILAFLDSQLEYGDNLGDMFEDLTPEDMELYLNMEKEKQRAYVDGVSAVLDYEDIA